MSARPGAGPRVRTGGASDIPAVLALWRESGEARGATDSAEALSGLLEHDPEALILAEAGDAIVGSLIAAWDGWRGSFYRLAVAPGWRRRGVATQLVRAGEARLRALGATRLTALVDEALPLGARFWPRLGYTYQAGVGRFVLAAGETDAPAE